MSLVHIAELHPELSASNTKQFKAAVTLIWPYSSSQRQFALLLAEPDVRLRRKQGQVRARFSGSSAKALATTGVGIGDEVILSLRGAQFVQEDAVSTPGRSIDWELQYTQTVAVHVFRDGAEIASLELQDAAPTPATRSPVRRQNGRVSSTSQHWSSPAFLKRVRLSDGPFFETPYDSSVDEHAEGHDKKRRRKSYKDWKEWTYSARTPSPEKGDVRPAWDMDDMEVSPSRPSQAPQTPVSPLKAHSKSITAGHLHAATTANVDVIEKDNHQILQVPDHEALARDEEHYDFYAGPDEDRPSDTVYAFGGDTEENIDEEEEALEDTNIPSMSSTEAVTKGVEQGNQKPEQENAQKTPSTPTRVPFGAITASTTAETGLHPASLIRNSVVVTIDSADSADAESAMAELARTEVMPKIVMSSPNRPFLDTSFHVPPTSGPSTPIGIEPASPTLQPLDSALLPLPSPFPGEHDQGATSYFDQASAHEQPVQETQEEGPPSEASYIMENSFFSSIGSSKTNALHPDHESAFAPVRFTFGMDGAWSSKPLSLPSPAPENDSSQPFGNTEENIESTTAGGLAEIPEITPGDIASDSRTVETNKSFPFSTTPAPEAPTLDPALVQESISPRESLEAKNLHPEMIESSYSGAEESQQREVEKETTPVEVVSIYGTEQDNVRPIRTDRSQSQSSIIEYHKRISSTVDTSITQDDTIATETRLVESEDNQNYSELITVDCAPTLSDFTANDRKIEVSHAATQGGLQDFMEAEKNDLPLGTDLVEPYSALEIPDTFMVDHVSETDHFQDGQWNTQDADDFHPDVKIESTEEQSMFRISELEEHDQQEGAAELSGEMLIQVPDEGYKVGELHTILVPSTGPARNTRSKTNTSESPANGNIFPPKRTTTLTKSKSHVTLVASTTTPYMTRNESPISPLMEAHRTSPDRLHSQLELFPSSESTHVLTPTRRQSPRKHASQRSVDSLPDVNSSQRQDLVAFLEEFQPLQELDASQGRYSNVSLVKDSEEESLHSEHSLSTVRYSDDWNTFTNFSDPVAEYEPDDFANLRPPPASAPQAETRAAVRTEWKRSGPQVAVSSKSSSGRLDPTHSLQSSPSRKLRSAGSMEAASLSPQATRVTRQHSRSLSIASHQEALSDVATPKAHDHHESAQTEDRVDIIEILTSPLASASVDRNMRGSPTAAAVTSQSLNRQSIMDSNNLITPEATQQTTAGSHDSFPTDQEQTTLPITPQLTQAASAGSRSFKKSMTTEDTEVEAFTKASRTRITSSTPRRNATQVDLVSPSTTPKVHSPDLSSDMSETAVEDAEQPSVGLSTPLAYYTPLKSLSYFLNRSSQFHTASNPDVLALVTSSSTVPQRATKGRKDWSTTLHITDISTYPTTTTVNIFRPYQNALPAADPGDIVLLRAFAVKSLNRHPTLTSADESSWCVWRYAKPVWGAKRGPFAELRAREEVKGPEVERGEGEWREVEKIRAWYQGRVKAELEDMVHTRSQDSRGELVQGSQGSTRM